MPLLTWIQKLLRVPERFETRGRSGRPARSSRRRRPDELVQLYLTRLEDRRVLNADFSFDALGGALTLDNFTQVDSESLTVRDAGDHYEFSLSEGVWTQSGGDAGVAGEATGTISILKSLVQNIHVLDNAAIAIDPDLTFESFTGLTGTFTTDGLGNISQTASSQVEIGTLAADAAGVFLDQADNDFGTVAVTVTAGATLVDVNSVVLASSAVGTDFSVTAGGSITRADAATMLTAGGDLFLTAGGDLGAPGESLAVQVGGTASLAATGSDVFLTSDQDLVVDQITTGAGADEVHISTTGTAHLTLTGTGGYTGVGSDQFFLSTEDGDLTIQTTPLTVGTLDARTGAGDVTIAADTSADGDVTIDSGRDVTLAADVSLSSTGGDIEIDATRTITLQAGSSLSTVGSGAIALDAGRNILLDSNSSIATLNGAVTLSANQAAPAAGTFAGIELISAHITSAGGHLTLAGRGGDTDDNNRGVFLHSGATVTTTAGGGISITGTGGDAVNRSAGVTIHGVGTQVASVHGDVSITGLGGNSSGFNSSGILVVDGAVVDSTGSGSVMLDGTGGTGTFNNDGVVVEGSDTLEAIVRAANGALVITGRGGTATSGEAYGILIDTARIESTGTATITLDGTGGTGAEDVAGILLEGGALVTSATGAILLTGQGGSGPGDAYDGILIFFGAVVRSTGSATITLIGTAGDGPLGDNVGIGIEDGGRIESLDGAISLTGFGGSGDPGDNVGILVGGDGAAIESTGLATITLNGTAGAGAGADENVGILIDEGGRIASAFGAIHLTGQGGLGATGERNDGIAILTGGVVESTGTGPGAATITMVGTSGDGIGDHQGIAIRDGGTRVSSIDGAIDLTGFGGTGFDVGGIAITDAAHVQSTGTATITLAGTGGTGPGESFGIILEEEGSLISSVDGTIRLVGTGGSGPGDAFGGVGIFEGGRIESTGTAGIEIIGIAGSGGSESLGHVGVVIEDAQVVAAAGSIHITGQGGGDGPENAGIAVIFGGVAQTAGDGVLTLRATAGDVVLGDGALVAGAGGVNVTAEDGDILEAGANTNANILTPGPVALAASGSIGGAGADEEIDIHDATVLDLTAGDNLTVRGNDQRLTSLALTVDPAGPATYRVVHFDGLTVDITTDGTDLTVTTLAAVSPTDLALTSTTGDVAIHEVDAVSGTVRLTAVAGSLLDGNGPGLVNVTGGALAAAAATGIDLDTRVDALAARTDSGSIDLRNDGAVVIGTVALLSGVTITNADGTATGSDHITITAASPLTVDMAVVNLDGGNITLAAEGGDPGDDLTLNADVTAAGGDGSIHLFAGDSILVAAGVTVSAAGAGEIHLLAGTDFNDGSPQPGHAGGSIEMADGSFVESENGNVTLRAPGDILLSVVSTAATVIVTADSDLDGDGAILDNTAGESPNIIAQATALRAGSGIGTGTSGPGDINTLVEALAALTASGDIHLRNAGELAIATVDGLAGATITNADGTATGNDHITITAASPLTVNDAVANLDGGDITLTAAGGTAADVLTLDADVTAAGGDGSIAFAGFTILHTSGAVSTQGAGAVSYTADERIELHPGASITTVAGGITLSANQGAIATSGNFVGIDLDGATILTTDGHILLEGRGGHTGGSNVGVRLRGGTLVESLGTGTITVSGTGGAGDGSTNVGVMLRHAGTTIRSLAGDISITGLGGGSGAAGSNHGVAADGSGPDGPVIESTGTGPAAANITIAGLGGPGGSSKGVALSSSTVTTIDGDIRIEGQGGGGGNGNLGVEIFVESRIRSTGTTSDAGTITILGTGGGGVSSNFGVSVLDRSLITSVMGDIAITGSGGSDGSAGSESNAGVRFLSSTVESTGTDPGAATITIVGTGGAGQSSNYGVELFGIDPLNPATVRSLDGAISITGTGQSNGQAGSVDNDGVRINVASVLSTGLGTDAATITITGTGANGTDNNAGIHLTGTTTRITSVDGAVQLTGTGGAGTGLDNHGIDVQNFATLASTGSATITLQGAGGTGLVGIAGIRLSDSALITSADGAIQLDGQGGSGAGRAFDGIQIVGDAAIRSTGTATVTLDGRGGSGSHDNRGIALESGGSIESLDGDVSLLGQGGAGAGGENAGIGIDGGAGPVLSGIRATGLANVSLVGFGGSGAAGGENSGILLENGALVEGSALITLDGTGGDSEQGDNLGIALDDASIRSTGTPAILLIGRGGTSSDPAAGGNIGIGLTAGSRIEALGGGDIDLSGTGGTGESGFNIGIGLEAASSVRTLGNGAIRFTGTGGSGAGGLNIGIGMTGGALVQAEGTGGITFEGTAGSGTSSNAGVLIEAPGTRVTSLDGGIWITGTGGDGAGFDNHGIHLHDSALIDSTGAATITLAGTGGTGADEIAGIRLTGSTLVTSVSGAITLTGQGGSGPGGAYDGIQIFSGSAVESTGAARISLHGTGGSGARDNLGIALENGGRIESVDGEIDLVGFGGAGPGGDHKGIGVSSGSIIRSTGAADIFLEGTGGSLDGLGGGGTPGGNFGLEIAEGALIEATGTGFIELTGTAGTDSSAGVVIDGDTTIVRTVGLAPGDIGIDALGGDLVMSGDSRVLSDSGDIGLRSTGHVLLGLVNADADGSGAAGTVGVQADSDFDGDGAILDNLSTEDANITGAAALLLAGSGIGTASDDVNLAVAAVAARTGTGPIHLLNDGALAIDTVSITVDVETPVSVSDSGATIENGADDDHITIRATGPLDVLADVLNVGGGDIRLAAIGGGNLSIAADVTADGGSAGSGGDILLDADTGEFVLASGATVTTTADGAGVLRRIVVAADSIDVQGTLRAVAQNGGRAEILLAPDSADMTIHLGAGANAEGGFALDDVELNNIEALVVRIGVDATYLNRAGQSLVAPAGDPARPFASETTGDIVFVGDFAADAGFASEFLALRTTGQHTLADAAVRQNAGAVLDLSSGDPLKPRGFVIRTGTDGAADDSAAILLDGPGHNFDAIAATTGGRQTPDLATLSPEVSNAAVTIRDGVDALSVASIDGLDGISTGRRTVMLAAGSDLLLEAPIRTFGGDVLLAAGESVQGAAGADITTTGLPGTNSGMVSIDAGTSVNLAAAIDTTGTDGAPGADGDDGGTIHVTAGTTITLATVISSGGRGGDDDGPAGHGGDGGQVNLTAGGDVAITTLTLAGGRGGDALGTTDGDGGDGGHTGNLNVVVTGGTVSLTNVDMSGGDGGDRLGTGAGSGGRGGDGGEFAMNVTGPVVLGTILTRGGAGGNATVAGQTAGAGGHGGRVHVTATDGSIDVLIIDASGGNAGAAGGGAGGSGGNAADISLTTLDTDDSRDEHITLGGRLRARGGTGAAPGMPGAHGTVLITSAAAIIDADDLLLDIDAGAAALEAVLGVAGNASLHAANEVLEIDVETLAAATETGNIVVTDVAGGLTIGLVGDTPGVRITGPGGTADDHIIITALSPLTVDAPVLNLVGGDIVLTATDDADPPEPDDLTLNADVRASGGDGHITLNGENLLVAPGVTVSAAGAGSITAHVTSTTTLGDDALLETAGGPITLNTDDLVLSTTPGSEATIDAAGGIVTIRNSSAGRQIDLGSDTAGQLGLTDAELDRVLAGILRIGRDDALASGAITVSAPISPAGTDVLHLLTGSTVSGPGFIVIEQLAVEAGDDVTLVGPNDVDLLAIHALSGGSNVSFRDVDGFTVSSVDGVDGVRAAGFLELRADAGDITIEDVTGHDLQAGATIAVTLDGANALLTFKDGVNVQGTGGSHTYTADRFDLAGASTITATNQAVLIQNRTAGRLIDLGSVVDDTPNTLELSNSELGRVLVGPDGVLRIGRNDAHASGDITVTDRIDTSLPGSTHRLHLITGGSVTATDATGGSIVEQQLAIEAGGPVTLNNPLSQNNVDLLAIRVLTGGGPGSIDFADADGFTAGTVDGVAGVTTNNGSVSLAATGGTAVTGAVTIENTALASDVAATGAITISLAADEALFTIAAGADVASSGGTHAYTADKMDLAGTISAAGQTVILQPTSPGEAIHLGSTTDLAADTLELSDAELDRITADRLVIGRNDGANSAGRISVSAISLDPAKVLTLNLLTGADVVESSPDPDADITVTHLAILSVTGVRLDVDVTGHLAVRNSGSGGVHVTDTAGGLTVDAVAVLPTGGPEFTLNEVTTAGGGITLVAHGPLTINGLVSETGGGDITLTAVDDLAAPEPDNLTINANVTATGGDGSIFLSGENVLIGANVTVSVEGAGSIEAETIGLITFGPDALVQTAGGPLVITANDIHIAHTDCGPGFCIPSDPAPATLDVGPFGTVVLRTFSDGRTIGLGTPAGQFNLKDAEVDRIRAGMLQIGRRDFDEQTGFNASGTITVGELTLTKATAPTTLVLLTGADVIGEPDRSTNIVINAETAPGDPILPGLLGIRARTGVAVRVDVSHIAIENQAITLDPRGNNEVVSGMIDVTDTDGLTVPLPGFVVDSADARNDGLTVSSVPTHQFAAPPAGILNDAAVIDGVRNETFTDRSTLPVGPDVGAPGIRLSAVDDNGTTSSLMIERPIITNGGDILLLAQKNISSVKGPGGAGDANGLIQTTVTNDHGTGSLDSGKITIRAAVGLITFQATTGTIDLEADVISRGADAAAFGAAVGGRGGRVRIMTGLVLGGGGGAIDVALVDASGGAGGGSAGDIDITANRFGSHITLHAQLKARGGSGAPDGGDGAVRLTAAGAILDADDDHTDIVAGQARLVAALGVGQSGAPGVLNNDLEIDVATLAGRTTSGDFRVVDVVGGLEIGTVDATKPGELSGIVIFAAGTEIHVEAQDGSLVVNDQVRHAGAGNITLRADNNIELNNLVSTPGTGRVTLVAGNPGGEAAGKITDGNLGLANVIAHSLVAIATDGVGTASKPIDTVVTLLEAAGGLGGVFLSNTGALTVRDLDAALGDPGFGITARGDDIVVTTIGAFTIDALVENRGPGDITLASPGAGDLTVNASVRAKQGGSIALHAGADKLLIQTPGGPNPPLTIISVVGSGTITGTAAQTVELKNAQAHSATGVVSSVAPRLEIVSTPQITQTGIATLTLNAGIVGTETNLRIDVDWGDGTPFGQDETKENDPLKRTTLVVTGAANGIVLMHRYDANPDPNDAAAPIPIRVLVSNDPLINFFGSNTSFGGVPPSQIPERLIPDPLFDLGVDPDSLSVSARRGLFRVPGEGLGGAIFVLDTGGAPPLLREFQNPLPVFETTQFTTFVQSVDFSVGAVDQTLVDERMVVLEVLQPDGATVDRVVFRGEEADDILNNVPLYLKRLPDGRYRILLKEPGEERLRLIRDLLLRDGVPSEFRGEDDASVGDARERFAPAERVAGDGRIPDQVWEVWAGRRRIVIERWADDAMPVDRPADALPAERIEPAGDDSQPLEPALLRDEGRPRPASAEAAALPAAAGAMLAGASLLARPLRTGDPEATDRTMARLARRSLRSLRRLSRTVPDA